MEDLVLKDANTMEENILAVLDFVKQVEKENGFTDEQILHKYSCGCCGVLADDIIKTTLERILGSVKELECVSVKTDSKRVPTHTYLKLKKQSPEKDLYFDIFGKKTYKEVEEFTKSKFWDKEFAKPWVEKFEKTNDLGDYIYVVYECITRISTEGVTV